MDVEQFAMGMQRLSDNIEQVIHGKTDVIHIALVCLLADGHLLMEDVPGTGKTMLARSIAASIHGQLRRIQFTPDLLPSDVTGVSIYDPNTGRFSFYPGPVFANVVLADEINRASPKTQSALLEVMEEGRVTVDGVPNVVPSPFMVIATQNPVEMEGTYRLPEAQLDRFLMRCSMGHPDVATEVSIIKTHGHGSPIDELKPVMTVNDIALMIAAASTVHTADGIIEYAARIADATRNLPDIRLGASTRGALGLVRASRALAAADGRAYVTPEDIKKLATPVLAHRILLTPEAELQGRTAESLLEQAVASVPVPVRRS